MLKTKEQAAARHLRSHGLSLNEIREALDVSKGSVSGWVRAVELGPVERARLLARVRRGPIVSAERNAADARELRRRHQEDGRARAQSGDASYMAGCMLYWAEGAKHRNSVKLTNSDPELIVQFATFLRQHFGVAGAEMRVYCNLFADHLARQRELEDFWLGRLGLDRSSLRKSTVNTYSRYSQKKRDGKLPYGTTTLVVHSTRIVQTIYGSIQEYGGFDRPEWLD